MGNVEGGVCATMNSMCGDPPTGSAQEDDIKREIIPNTQQNYNQQRHQQYNGGYQQYPNSNNMYQPPMTSNINTYNNMNNSTNNNNKKKYPTKQEFEQYIEQKYPTPNSKNENTAQYQTETVRTNEAISNDGYYDKIYAMKIKPEISNLEIIKKVEKECDKYCNEMLNRKIFEIFCQNASNIDYPDCVFPARYDSFNNKLISICSCFDGEDLIYKISSIDEYFGDLDNIHKYDDLNKYGIDNVTKESFKDLPEAKDYIFHRIYKPLFESNNYIKRYRYNQWSVVDDKGISDRWLTLIAFCGFAAHRTTIIKLKENNYNNNPDIMYINDVSFLSFYDVRDGYIKYGAAAYFDSNHCIKKIFVSYNKSMYVPGDKAWDHAKWIWKVSVTVCTFLIDMVSHCRFREASGLIKAVRSTLKPNHPIRRLLIPFTFGTVYANRVYNEYLAENGLFHRCFAFKYDSLCKLMTDSMSDAPKQRQPGDAMKYRFKLIRKKVSSMKNCKEEIYPLYNAIWSFFASTLKFVDDYMKLYYNDKADDDSALYADPEIVSFYDVLIKNCGIPTKFKLKKFNISNILAHFICNSSLWNNHLSGSLSFEYLIDPRFNGLKIDKLNLYGNTIQNYNEYCLMVLCVGWNLMDFEGRNIGKYNNKKQQRKMWKHILLRDNKLDKNIKIFEEYFDFDFDKKNNEKNKKQYIAPYNAANPKYFASSIML